MKKNNEKSQENPKKKNQNELVPTDTSKKENPTPNEMLDEQELDLDSTTTNIQEDDLLGVENATEGILSEANSQEHLLHEKEQAFTAYVNENFKTNFSSIDEIKEKLEYEIPTPIHESNSLVPQESQTEFKSNLKITEKQHFEKIIASNNETINSLRKQVTELKQQLKSSGSESN